ncbi:hypothetical protein RE432_14905 [Pusillimonas sp. SM2304]|uniref:hypothetical protein n=1 Tax=Pusillimonas sp. SM2304 TaxID=3073241 RepID=UPI002873FE59|nr:hypothetical protein [Pusillimonas sp. SM2304]MDS1141728.1 hypothetical protein [Pusillimonas sp. SM2304]
MTLENLVFDSIERLDPVAIARKDASKTVEKPEVNVNILALDLANKCGWAVRCRDGRVLHGTVNFTPKDGWSPGQRWQRFRSWLASIIVEHQVGAIVYEQVLQGGWKGGNAGHRSGAAGDLYGGFKALVELAADSHNTTLDTANVATVKKLWTGNGRADKAEMVAEASRRGFRVRDDNEADALGILHWAIAKETGAWKPAPKKPKPKHPAPGRRVAPAAPGLFTE